MARVTAVLLKPLDGDAIGSTREFEGDDFARLEAMGAVERATGKTAKAAKAPLNKKATDPLNKAAGPRSSRSR